MLDLPTLKGGYYILRLIQQAIQLFEKKKRLPRFPIHPSPDSNWLQTSISFKIIIPSTYTSDEGALFIAYVIASTIKSDVTLNR